MIPADVPSGPLVVDTNVVSYIFLRKGRWQEFYDLIQGHVGALSFASVGELRSWGYAANWPAQKVASLENVMSSYVILPATDAVTQQFGAMYHRFRGHLGTGGTNDMWSLRVHSRSHSRYRLSPPTLAISKPSARSSR